MQRNFDLAPEHWAALRRLLDEALDRPADERNTWIESLDARYDGFKPRLRALLEHAARGTSALPLDTLPKVETAQFLAERRHGEEPLHAGTAVGPYRLVRPLGEGGMGEVWLAERTDILHKRQVALKLPRLVTGRARLAERLAREREILAALNHPNIARLYDAGLTSDGQPYLALEYVEGQQIDAYSARKELDVSARLRLFLQVTSAVAHAHAQLVVHRDLKPSNILVTEAGEVRLLDFGIAKLLDNGQARETALTQLAGLVLTPDYASPEQILGQPIGTAADIYSLGVVLFELLTGGRPYRLRRDSRAALEDAILQADVRRPSDATAEPKLRKQLRGDLDTIVLKALKKAPTERYGTAQALAEDIERYLGHRPVKAQPDALGYRLRKFVARNRYAVGGAAAMLAAVLAGTTMSVWQARVARHEQQRAEEVKNFISSIFNYADPYRGGGASVSATDLLRRAAQRIDQIDKSRPDTRVELLVLLGDKLMLMQDTDTAESVVKQAEDEGTRLLGAEHPLTLSARLQNLQVHRFRGRTKELRADVEVLVPLLRRNRQFKDLAWALQFRAHAALDDGRFADAEAAAEEGLASALASLGEEHNSTVQMAMMLAQTQQFGRPRPALALRSAESAMQLVLKVRHGDAGHPQVTDMRHIYGRALNGAGQHKRAVKELERALQDAAAAVGATGRKVAFISSNLARAQRRAGMLQSALASHDRSQAIMAKEFKPEAFSYAGGVLNRALTYNVMRQPVPALRDLMEAEPLIVKSQGADHANVFLVRQQIALARAWLGEAEAAEGDLKTLIAGFKSDDPSAYAAPHYALGIAQRLRGEPSAALASQQRALELYGTGAAVALDRAHVNTEIGLSLLELGRHEDAIAVLRPLLDTYPQLQSEVTPQFADTLLGAGRALLAARQTGEACVTLDRAGAFWRTFEPTSRSAREAARWVAQCHASQGRLTQAHRKT